MGRDDGRPPDVTWVDPEPEEPLQGPRRRPRWPWWGALALAVIAALVIALVQQPAHRRAAAPTTTAPTAPTAPLTPSASASSPLTPSTRATGPTVIADTGRPLLGITAGWDLFARDGAAVYRIQLSRGRVTRTPAGVGSSGPVAFLVGPGWVIVRPWDNVPGYLVPDGQPPRDLTGVLTRGGPLLPGPAPGEFWAQANEQSNDLTLVGLNGQQVGPHPPTISIPNGVSYPPTPDGGGYLLVSGTGGVYGARPDGMHRISSGTLLAVGLTRWLVAECDASYHCTRAVIDPATGTRHVLGPVALSGYYPPAGTIAPNGVTAALAEPDNSNNDLHLLDLITGRERTLPVTMNQDQGSSSGIGAVWSPDSRWLFVDAANGVVAIDPHTGAQHPLGVPLPALVDDLAIRPTAGG